MYAIVLPVYLTELLFPSQRDIPWVSDRGLGFAVGIFIFSSIGVWQLWSRVGLPRYGHSVYRVPPIYIGVALIVIACIIVSTLAPRPYPHSMRKTARRAPMPWLVGLMSFGFSLAWFIMIALAYIPASTFNDALPLIPILIGAAWVGLGLLVIKYITAASDWQDRHRLTLIFGASVGRMLGGTLVILTASPIDIIGKFGFDLIAIVLFIWFTLRLRGRSLSS